MTEVQCTGELDLLNGITEHWSGYLFPFPGDLRNPGIKLGSPALQADSLPTEVSGKPKGNYNQIRKNKDPKFQLGIFRKPKLKLVQS